MAARSKKKSGSSWRADPRASGAAGELPQPSAAAAAPPRAVSAAGEAHVTLIIGGGIAAYKSLDLIRRLKERHINVRCVLTKAAQQFVTPLVASGVA